MVSEDCVSRATRGDDAHATYEGTAGLPAPGAWHCQASEANKPGALKFSRSPPHDDPSRHPLTCGDDCTARSNAKPASRARADRTMLSTSRGARAGAVCERRGLLARIPSKQSNSDRSERPMSPSVLAFGDYGSICIRDSAPSGSPVHGCQAREPGGGEMAAERVDGN